MAARGALGDADPLQALDDGVRSFSPTEVLIATHPEGLSNWLEHGLVAQARERFDVPITHVIVDAAHDEARLVEREAADSAAPAHERPTSRDLVLLGLAGVFVILGSLLSFIFYAPDWLIWTWVLIFDLGFKIAAVAVLWVLFQRAPGPIAWTCSRPRPRVAADERPGAAVDAHTGSRDGGGRPGDPGRRPSLGPHARPAAGLHRRGHARGHLLQPARAGARAGWRLGGGRRLHLGGASLAALDMWLPHAHERFAERGHAPPPREPPRRRALMLLAAITIHNVPEGLAVGVAFAAGGIDLGVPVAPAITLQNIPEGFAAAASRSPGGCPASPRRRRRCLAGRRRWRATRASDPTRSPR